VKGFVDQYKGARQRRDLIPYMFDIFVEDFLPYTAQETFCRILLKKLFAVYYSRNFLPYTTQETLHAPVTGKLTVPGLLFTSDLKIALFNVSNLQKAINWVAKHCVN
jgi:hypothetical protein